MSGIAQGFSSRTACIVRHMPWQDAGLLAPVLRLRGYDVVYVDAMLKDEVDPRVAQADVRIVLGGPNGAYDERAFARLTRELRLVEKRLESDLPLRANTLALQFHLEPDPSRFEEWLVGNTSARPDRHRPGALARRNGAPRSGFHHGRRRVRLGVARLRGRSEWDPETGRGGHQLTL